MVQSTCWLGLLPTSCYSKLNFFFAQTVIINIKNVFLIKQQRANNAWESDRVNYV